MIVSFLISDLNFRWLKMSFAKKCPKALKQQRLNCTENKIERLHRKRYIISMKVSKVYQYQGYFGWKCPLQTKAMKKLKFLSRLCFHHRVGLPKDYRNHCLTTDPDASAPLSALSADQSEILKTMFLSQFNQTDFLSINY